jgi:hypothetical protein
LQRDLFCIEKIRQDDRHNEERDLLDYRGKAVIQLIEEPWQLKTLR